MVPNMWFHPLLNHAFSLGCLILGRMDSSNLFAGSCSYRVVVEPEGSQTKLLGRLDFVKKSWIAMDSLRKRGENPMQTTGFVHGTSSICRWCSDSIDSILHLARWFSHETDFPASHVWLPEGRLQRIILMFPGNATETPTESFLQIQQTWSSAIGRLCNGGWLDVVQDTASLANYYIYIHIHIYIYIYTYTYIYIYI